ncbi:TPA: phage holin [Streptococcus suis]|nr:phage holin [Streptococcus suis]NRH05188.1 phage holin [Streptococcus suis]HEL2235813.1 phage holin [Streptococcus suis]HEL2239782.1 phage holin [Streptococcus suis]
MEHLTELILGTATGIFGIVGGMIVHEVKKYLVAKGGKRAIEITEILARNAVNAVEQIAGLDQEKHVDKYDMAKRRITSQLAKYNIYMTDTQLETFIESAVKQMNDSWKGEQHGNSK